jgi:hypothetical protein
MRSFLLLFSSGVLALGLAAACGGKVTPAIGQGGDGGSGSSGGGSSGGSGGSGSGSSSGNVNSCLETSGSSQACISCIETECGPSLASVETGCIDLINCECPGGIFSESAAQACAAKAQEVSCTGPAQQIGQCETQYCESACVTSSSGGGGGSSSSGGSGGSGGSGSSGGPLPPGCTFDTTLGCSDGAIGYACAAGDNPEAEYPGLSCSTPTEAAGEDDYCCFYGGAWSSATCVPDDALTSVCPDPGEYGYQCDSGDDPTSDDSLLNCSAPTPDADGVHDDFCCTY